MKRHRTWRSRNPRTSSTHRLVSQAQGQIGPKKNSSATTGRTVPGQAPATSSVMWNCTSACNLAGTVWVPIDLIGSSR